MIKTRIRINHQIRAPKLRVIGENGVNLGVISLSEALKKAGEVGLDLIEISPLINPPVAKIMDYGKFQYTLNKKQKAGRAKTKTVEVKGVQVKIGTGEHDLELKAKKVSEWLEKGYRAKIELFLPGRAKYMDKKFLEERLNRIFKFMTAEYKVAEPLKRGPKGLVMMIEKEQ